VIKTLDVTGPSEGPYYAAHVIQVAFSPTEPLLVSADKDSRIIFWNSQTWEREKSLPVDGLVHLLAVSRDGSRLVAVLADGGLLLYDINEARILAERQADSDHLGVNCLVASHTEESNLFATGDEDGTVTLWDHDLEVVETLSAGAPVRCASFSYDDSRLAVGTDTTHAILVWEKS
jgi:WD40 repeat protein